MNLQQIKNRLRVAGFWGFQFIKTDGIYYLIDGERVVNENIERCLHCVRIDKRLLSAAMAKARELTEVKS